MTNTIAGLPILDVAEQSDWLKGLIYGIPGVGKTFLLGQLHKIEDFKPILWIDAEKGTRTIRSQKGLDVVRIVSDVDEKGKLKKAAWTKLEDLCNKLYEGGHNYRTIVIDNLSECERMSMEYTLQLAVAKRSDHDPLIAEQRDWGKSNEQVAKMVRYYRDLEANVWFTAHTREVKNDAGVVIQTVPGLPGQLAFKVAGFLDFVGYYYMKDKGQETQRLLLTKPTEKFIAKDRSDMLPKLMEQPKMEDIVNGLLSNPLVEKAKDNA